MTKRISLPVEIRKYLEVLADLKMYANSRNDGRWAWQTSDPKTDGVYGAANTTIKKILTEVYGAEFAEEVMNNINYGGGSTAMDDLTDAINLVYERVEEREKEKKIAEIMEKARIAHDKLDAARTDLYKLTNECRPYVTDESFRVLCGIHANLNACLDNLVTRFEPDQW